MKQGKRVILFTERNSPFGAGVMERVSRHSAVGELLVVTRPPFCLCDYYIYDAQPVFVLSLAAKLGHAVLETDEIHDDRTISRLRTFAPDIIVLANYQLKIHNRITSLAKQIAINFHPGPLPRYAGLAPFFWMARNGETDAGVSCCIVADKIDGGALIHSQRVRLVGTETSLEIRERLFTASFDQVVTVFDQLARDRVALCPQNLEARTYYGKPDDTDITIDWAQSTETVMRLIRAGAPLPGAVTLFPNGNQVRIREARPAKPDNSATPGTVLYTEGLPMVHTGDGAVQIMSWTSYCPIEQGSLSATPLRFDPAVPLPQHSFLALLATGTTT